MIRYITRETYVGHVVHAGGNPEVSFLTFDGDQDALERYLRYEDQPKGERPEFFMRELLGVELL